MENRFFTYNQGRWFGPDGKMDNLLDPLKEVEERSARSYDEKSIYLETMFTDPVLPQNSSALAYAVKEKYFQLEVDFIQLRLWDHPLFGTENLLASQLEQMYLEWVERKALDLPK